MRHITGEKGENIKFGDEVYNGSGSIITVKSISKSKLILSVDGCFVEPNEDGTINLRKDPIKKMTLKSGQTIEIVSQTMDAGVELNISYE